MTKLLSQEELRKEATELWKLTNYLDFSKRFIDLIQSQKQAHADAVIGKDEPRLENLTGVDHDRFTRNWLRAKQRERNRT